VTAAVPLRVEILVTISVCAKAEKPSPPKDFGMMIPRKPFSRMNFHTSGDRSMRWWVVSHSSSIPQSSSTGPSTNACSSALSLAWGYASSLSQSGRPLKRSASHQMLPASRASCSVCEICGSTFL
jgi:hypothetical protein